MQTLLFLLAFLLSPGAEAGEIIGGHEVKPHSRPYMAFVRYLIKEKRKNCGGVLVRQDIVLTAAHCWGSSIKVTLGAHNIKKQEKTQQVISVKEAIPHPHYNSKKITNDIMILKEVELTVQQDQVCKSYLRNYNSTTQLCVGDPKEEKSSYKGDSGGPFVCKKVIQGLVSYGRSGGIPPRVYTKVSSFLPWIKKIMKVPAPFWRG
ncbi:granzyme B-like isoform X1 [Equus quagga]|uniref:granzyme B-like isoform X1 n=1 Tax=Equus quagga TaxID=89248 RepID=UPI001EE1AC85|nr:granzyme B-like isoform X1 [Equus quagga]